MATATLQNANLRFPSGTSVAAYPETQRGAGGGGPTGSATETATVAANGTLTFSSLVAGTNYVAYALVAGEHRYMGFSAPPSTGLDPSTFWASDAEVQSAADAAVTSSLGDLSIVIDVTKAPYNAQFDNSTDDTVAIQAALDAAIEDVPGVSGADDAARIVQLPPGRAVVGDTITVPSNVWLRGHGPSGTYLYRPAGAVTTPVVKVLVAGVQQMISDLGIICDDNDVDCLVLTGGQVASILSDSRPVVRDVVTVGGRDGVVTDHTVGQANELRLSRVTSQRAQRDGFSIDTTDAFIEGCTAGAGGTSGSSNGGFYIRGANTRIYGCKAYGNDGAGFNIAGSGRHEVACCEAQDCDGDGFVVQGGQPSILTGCVSDSCSGVGFHSNAFDSPVNRIDGYVINRTGGSYSHQAAYLGRNANVKIQTFGDVPRLASNQGADYTSGLADLDNRFGAQQIAYAATVTPDPWLGQDVYVGTLTGNVAIANPAPAFTDNFWPTIPVGMNLCFRLAQDATGTRTVTFGANYKTTAAIDTTASTVTEITFKYDGTYWRETSRAKTT